MPAPDDDLLARFAALFEGLRNAHGTHGVPERDINRDKWKIKSTARYVREPVTLDHWRQHVAGSRPLGIVPIREDNTCSWGAIDLDEYDRTWTDVIQKAEHAELPLVPVRSKSGGLHLFIFLTEPAPARDVTDSLREMAARIGLSNGGDIEIFPKQSEIVAERNDGGSWIVVPYFGDTYGGRLQPQECLRRTGAAMTLAEFVRFAEGRRVPPERLTHAPKGSKAPGGAMIRPLRDGPYNDGPPCLQHLANNVVEPGVQNVVLFNIALYWKRRDEPNWRKRTEADAQAYFQPVPDSAAIQETLRSAAKKDYNFQCKTEPLRNFCNSRTCRTRRYGVGDAGDFPQLTGMQYLPSDPPIWFVDVDGVRVSLSTEQLQDYNKFETVAMEKLHRRYKGVNRMTWTEAVSAAMEDVQTLEVAEEATTRGTLKDHLEDFLTNRRRGKTKMDLHSGRPWEDIEAGRHYFRLKDLRRFLDSVSIGRDKVPSQGEVTTFIESLGGGRHQFGGEQVGGKLVRVFFVPSTVVEETPPAEVPADKEGVV